MKFHTYLFLRALRSAAVTLSFPVWGPIVAALIALLWVFQWLRKWYFQARTDWERRA